MTDVVPYSAALVLPAEMREAEVTIPGVQLWHYITDDQLLTLGDMRKEPVMEICLASAGVFAGSIVPTIDQLSRFGSKVNPMGFAGLCTLLITAIALGVAVVTAFLWRQRLEGHKSLVETIQSRKRVPVSTD